MAYNQSLTQALAKINVTNVFIEGEWMPREYVTGRTGRIRVVMLADVEMDNRANRAGWHATVMVTADNFFASVNPCRKLAVRAPFLGRPIEEWPFRQLLKRDLPRAFRIESRRLT
jgi:hypothetical protein